MRSAPGPGSCKEQLGSGPKALHGRSLAGRGGGGEPCKEQLGFLPDVHFSATCAHRNRSTGILKRTTFWCGLPRPLIKLADAHPGSDQRIASPHWVEKWPCARLRAICTPAAALLPSIYGRSIGAAFSHRLLSRSKGGLFAWESVSAFSSVILVEGLFDLAVLWQAGFRKAF
jgi:hypothetical protein